MGKLYLFSLPSNDPQLSWATGLRPAKSGPAIARFSQVFVGERLYDAPRQVCGSASRRC